MKNKTFKTLDEQLEGLSKKGLLINDYEFAKDILYRENYFFFNGYRHLLMETYDYNNFITGATFEELYAIFSFDRKMRNVMFKYILIIENNIKSITSYHLSKRYGYKEKQYLNPKNFKEEHFKLNHVTDVLSKMKRQIRINARQHRATKHYLSNYGYIPLWVSVKVLSFGIMAELFSILKIRDQEEISSNYQIDGPTLEIYLSVLSNYRNLCAHEDVLYDHRTQKSIPDTECHKRLNILKVDGEYLYGKNDLFSITIIFKKLLSERDFRDFFNELTYEIEVLDNKLNSVELDNVLLKMGMPDNWELLKEDEYY